VGPLFKEWADALLFCNYRTRLVEGADGRTRAKGGITDVIGSAIVGMATAGLLIPDPSPTGTLVAMTSGNRP
jgi:hypothetical protein